MSLLFDISPEEGGGQKKKKGSKKPKEPAPPESQPWRFDAPSRPPLGQVGDQFQCDNPKCQGAYFDILDDYKGEWDIECAYCGWKQRVLAVHGILKPRDEFVFSGGQHSGMTLAQVSETEGGMAYIRWSAEKHKSAPVKEACQKWLASVGYPASQRSVPCSS